MEANMLGGGSLQLQDAVFACDYNEPLVQQVVKAYLAGARSGTKAQLNRARTSGGGRKPWRQKGMGRARAGTIRSPLWRGGGRAFACQPRDFSQKVNRKMYQSSLRSILSELYRREQLLLIDRIHLSSHKTKDFIAQLQSWSLSSVLVVDEKINEELSRASGNVPQVGVLMAKDIDPVNVLRFEKVLVTRSAVAVLEAWLT